MNSTLDPRLVKARNLFNRSQAMKDKNPEFAQRLFEEARLLAYEATH